MYNVHIVSYLFIHSCICLYTCVGAESSDKSGEVVRLCSKNNENSVSLSSNVSSDEHYWGGMLLESICRGSMAGD